MYQHTTSFNINKYKKKDRVIPLIIYANHSRVREAKHNSIFKLLTNINTTFLEYGWNGWYRNQKIKRNNIFANYA
tara:strand:- start:4169 stop:4393 length:225 start_codon:yes stop_codon:yes gene_type:complete